MITLQKHEISAKVKNRYANIVYCFHFKNVNKDKSNELKLEMTIDPNAFISKFTADIDGELFIGKTKERETASKEYIAAKQKNENAILIHQPHKDIPNLFTIKTNIDAQSKVILTIEIQQYLQKTFNFNELNIQILRSFSKYNITQSFDHIAFDLTVEDISGIYDVNIPMINDSDIVIEEQKMDKFNQKCEITGKITSKSPEKHITEDVEWRKALKVKDRLDVEDKGGWYTSEVVEVTAEQVKIHYFGYDVKYDECIKRNSHRLAKYNWKTTNAKTNELTLKYKVKGEANDSHILFDKKSNTFCHIISDVITDSMNIGKSSGDNEGQNNIVNNNVLIPRRVIVVIDKSGSMGGLKWLKTISSTILAIKQLRHGYDRFGIILFNSEIKKLPSNDIRGCILANDENINDSIKALQNENVSGGTNINDALLKAIELIKIDILLLNNDPNIQNNFFMNQIIFITDGEPKNGETDTSKILMNVKNANDVSKIDKYNDKICIFSFGVGRDSNDSGWTKGLNHSFLKLLSVNNNGFYHRIKQSSADTELAQYFNILSKPILSNINIEYTNKNIKDLTKNKFNTLYCGNDLIICGKLDTKQNIDDYNLALTICAITGKEIEENNKLIIKPINIKKQMKININCESQKGNEEDINSTERIWAYLKLKQFATQKLIHNDMIEIDDDETKEDESEPLSLALKYKFISPWTSMIVVKKKQNENNIDDESKVNDAVNEIQQNNSALETVKQSQYDVPSDFISQDYYMCLESSTLDLADEYDDDDDMINLCRSSFVPSHYSRHPSINCIEEEGDLDLEFTASMMKISTAGDEFIIKDDEFIIENDDELDVETAQSMNTMIDQRQKMKTNEIDKHNILKKFKGQHPEMDFSNITMENDSKQKRIRKELKDLSTDQSSNYSIIGVNNDKTILNVSILGAVNSAYEGGKFHFEIKIPVNYPLEAPKCRFITKIYHCNIDENGMINLDLLIDKWSPVWTIKKLLLAIIQLLNEPNVSNPIIPNIAKLYQQNRQRHDKIVKEWVQKYAQK